MKHIATSTGMRPAELITGILNNNIKDKKIYIDTNINQIIKNSVTNNPKTVTKTTTKNIRSTIFDLSKPGDIALFTQGPLIKDHENDQTRRGLETFLRSNPVSIKDSKEFTLGLINALTNRNKLPSGVNALFVAKTIADSINGDDAKVLKLVEKSLKIFENGNESNPVKLQYNLLDSSDLKEFSHDPLLNILGEDETTSLINYLESKPVLNRDSNEFSSAIITSLNKTGSFPEYTTAVDIAKSIANKINGLEVNTTHSKFVNTLFKTGKETKTVPINYNFNNKTSINNFSKDKIFTSLNHTDQEELLNYLNSRPINKDISQQYSESLVRGLQTQQTSQILQDKSIKESKTNILAFAKALNKKLSGEKLGNTPKDVTNLITSSLKTEKETQSIPINYNFNSKTSINNFSKDKIFTSLNNTDQEELLNYLNSRPINKDISQQYSESLVRGLQTQQTSQILQDKSIKESKTNILAFAKALNKKLSGEKLGNTPKDVTNLITSSLKTEKETQSIPINYNFNNETSINNFSKDKIFTSLNHTDQEELLNYLNSKPINKDISQQYSESLVRGLQTQQTSQILQDKSIKDSKTNILAFAKALNKKLSGEKLGNTPKDVTNLITSSLKTEKETQRIPVNYNFNSKTSINNFSKDKIFTSLNNTDQEELLNYLNSRPINKDISQQYSESLVRGLQTQQTSQILQDKSIKESKTNILAFAKALNKKLSGEKLGNTPKDVTNLITSSLKTEKETQSIPINYNFNSNTSINNFSKDKIFTSLNHTDQEELLNYLNSRPINKDISQQYSESLVRGLQTQQTSQILQDKSIKESKTNILAFAKALNKKLSGDKLSNTPKDVTNLITSSLKTEKETQRIPINYNFNNETSINNFSKDKIFTSLNNTDQEELLNYLNSRPYPNKRAWLSQQYSESLVRGLQHNRLHRYYRIKI